MLEGFSMVPHLHSAGTCKLRLLQAARESQASAPHDAGCRPGRTAGTLLVLVLCMFIFRGVIAHISVHNQPCCYACALGYWDNKIERSVRPSLWDPLSEWSWRTFDDVRCPVHDHLSEVLLSAASRPAWFPVHRPLVLLLIGDSLDRETVRYLCSVGQTLKLNFTEFDGEGKHIKANGRTSRRHRGVTLCSNGAFSVVYYPMFGLVRPAMVDLAMQIETRKPASATLNAMDRLSVLLPHDFSAILAATKTDAAKKPFAVIMSSILWDLSFPTTNTSTVSASFVRLYAEAVSNLTIRLQTTFPSSPLFWRTQPATGYGDADGCQEKAKARPFLQRHVPACTNSTHTRRSQNMLNAAVLFYSRRLWRDGVIRGPAIDFDTLVRGYSHYTKDFVHYQPGPNLAYFNLALNAMREAGVFHQG